MLNLRYVMCLRKINGIFVWAGTDAASFLTEDEFISSCQDAANGENESGTVAEEEEILCVADAVTCAEIEPCVEFEPVYFT